MKRSFPDIVILTEAIKEMCCFDTSAGYFKPDGICNLQPGSVGVYQHKMVQDEKGEFLLDWYEFKEQDGIHHNAPYNVRRITPQIPPSEITIRNADTYKGYSIPAFGPGFLHKEMEMIYRRSWRESFRYMVEGYSTLQDTPLWSFACYALNQAEIWLTVTPDHEQAKRVLSFALKMGEYHGNRTGAIEQPERIQQASLFL